MNADVTAENKPAYSQHGISASVKVHENNAHKYQRAVQIFIVFLDEVAVVIIRCVMELIVELDGLVASRSEGRKESRQRFDHSIFHPERQEEGRLEGSDTEEER